MAAEFHNFSDITNRCRGALNSPRSVGSQAGKDEARKFALRSIRLEDTLVGHSGKANCHRVFGTDVLIVGAGPTGLVLALWLTKLGADGPHHRQDCGTGDYLARPSPSTRARWNFTASSISGRVIEKGHKVPAIGLWVEGKQEARLSFEDVGADVTPYPFLHIFPQDEHERLLIARLEALGVSVERQTELIGYDEDGSGIVARLRGPTVKKRAARRAYIAGCDGARSQVRQIMGTGFPGGTYKQIFYVADVEACGQSDQWRTCR